MNAVVDDVAIEQFDDGDARDAWINGQPGARITGVELIRILMPCSSSARVAITAPLAGPIGPAGRLRCCLPGRNRPGGLSGV